MDEARLFEDIGSIKTGVEGLKDGQGGILDRLHEVELNGCAVGKNNAQRLDKVEIRNGTIRNGRTKKIAVGKFLSAENYSPADIIKIVLALAIFVWLIGEKMHEEFVDEPPQRIVEIQ